MFKGTFVALVTPFKDEVVDEDALRDLVEFQLSEGISGIVPSGCTGEAATLSHEEQKMVIKIVVEAVNKRAKVIAGTGSNSTREALSLTKYARDVGADGAMLITPYYNKPTPKGQILHYSTIAKKVDIPIMLYNVPSRTGISILPETAAELSRIDNIVAIKEASGSLDQVSRIISLSDITVLSGDDSLTLPMMSVGASGVVSVVANVAPRLTVELVSKFMEGDCEGARKIHYKLLGLCKAMFIETNPIPLKAALKMMGKITGQLRLPMCDLSEENIPKVEKALQDAGISLTVCSAK